MTARACIFGISSFAITADERAFLREAEPFGLILFRRNVDTPEQLRQLTAAFREIVGRDAPVLIDQEGGRVQRLRPPHWPSYPPGAAYGRLYQEAPEEALAAAWLGARLIASDLHALGIDVDCLPLGDVPVAGADAVIGDRAYGDNAEQVSRIALALAEGLLQGGVLPVLKHLPGHGRATADSHLALPIVAADRASLEASDFAAFRPLKTLPLGMTAHVVFSAIDPVAPATTSAIMVGDVIRGSIGFEGLLMSDDVSMKALSGSLAARAGAALAAGCDVVLHCNGQMPQMQEIAAACPMLAGRAAERAQTALAQRMAPQPFDAAPARLRFAELMRYATAGTA
jgi:beta-N-acetylhexosaminidase